MSLAVPPAPSLANRLRSSLGLSQTYVKMDKEKEDQDLTTSQDYELSTIDSGRLHMLALMGRQNLQLQENFIDSDYNSEKQGAAVPDDPELSAFNLARRLGEGGVHLSVSRANQLAQRLSKFPEDCSELLRRNVFWPMLTACVEAAANNSDKDGICATLNTISIVLDDNASRKKNGSVLVVCPSSYSLFNRCCDCRPTFEQRQRAGRFWIDLAGSIFFATRMANCRHDQEWILSAIHG